jgi:predicted dehydrogenase
MPIRTGLVGLGKIARDQHVPAIHANGEFELVACASRNSQLDGVANFPTIELMLNEIRDLDAVAICTPPQVHYQAAKLALTLGKHVFLEKPPCTTTAQLNHLAMLAGESGSTLFQTWHSRHAPSVAPAKRWLQGKKLVRGHIVWKENVRKWHPKQEWIWRAGGFGIFDPGINAISILTEILPKPIFVKTSALYVPENCEAPIATDLTFETADGVQIPAEFDFRHPDIEAWDIDIETTSGTMRLSAGGSRLYIDGREVPAEGDSSPHCEYISLYRRFAELVRSGQSDVDARPFQLVADAFLAGSRHKVEAFID